MGFEHHSLCRFCHAACSILAEVKDGRVTRIVGNKDNPVYFGYTCKKGRTLPEQHYGPDRLVHCVKGPPGSGGHAPVGSEQALDEIAVQLQQIIRDHGPRAVALYSGSLTAWEYFVGGFVATSFFQQIGSPMVFGPHTIDQPGKPLALAIHGHWGGGQQEFHESDSWLLIGTNAAISKNGGIPAFNPEKRLRDEQARGLKLIVIDPRKSETACAADIHIQPVPGQDPTILAGLIRMILDEGLYDREFVNAETEGLGDLRKAVEQFTPEYVARRAQVPADQITAAARMFAAGRAGRAGCGTGPNMAPRGTLTEYLTLALNTLVGAWHRAGDKVTNPGVLLPSREWIAQAQPRPERVWGYGTRLRVRGLGESAAGMPTSALAEEILLEGEGQVRALFNLGGNPMRSFPDQQRTHAAMQALELGISCDMRMSLTAQFSHYVIPAKLTFEVPTTTLNFELLPDYGLPSFPAPYAQYAPAIVELPEGSDLLEEWEMFYGLAQRMGLQLDIFGQPIDMVNKPTTDDLLELASTGSRIPLSEVKAVPGGGLFPGEPVHVADRASDWPHRLAIGDTEMMAELRAVAEEPVAMPEDGETYRLVSRRMRDVYNSFGHTSEALLREYRVNPAFMNPADMAQLGLERGDEVIIANDYGEIRGIAEPDDALRPGVVSMAHGWGSFPGDPDEDPLVDGASTNRLVDATQSFDHRSGIPVMSAIPVRLQPARKRAETAGTNAGGRAELRTA